MKGDYAMKRKQDAATIEKNTLLKYAMRPGAPKIEMDYYLGMAGRAGAWVKPEDTRKKRRWSRSEDDDE
jgi:hypothetical protein